MEMSLIDALRSRRGFTDTDETLAEYVLSHAEAVSTMNVSQLAKATHVSNSAVVRFCKRLGLDGYRTFRIELARELERARVHAYNISPDRPFLQDASARDVMGSISSLSKQAIDMTYGSMSSASVRQAARLILEARHPVIYGVGDTRISCIAFSSTMLRMGILCTLGDQYGDTTLVGSALGPQDVAILVSYSGAWFANRPNDLQLVLESRCRTVAVTADANVRDLLPNLDCLVLLPHRESRSERIATFFSQECIRYALNSIYGEAFALSWSQSMDARDRYAKSDFWTGD